MRHALLALAAFALLGGCEAATEMAGEAIAGELRTQFIAQCEEIAESTGIASDRITPACECSADEFAADFAADGALEIDQARIERVLKTCVQEQWGTTEAAPAENENG